MAKWIPKILYIIFIGFCAYITAALTEAEKVDTFINQRKEEILSNDYVLLSSSVIAKTQGDSATYILEEPLFEESFQIKDSSQKVTNQIDLSIYAFVESGSNETNVLALVVRNLKISDSSKYLEDGKHTVIDATFYFSEHVTIGSKTDNNFTDAFAHVFDEDDTKLFTLDFDRIQSPNPIIIKRIELSYRLESQSSRSAINIYHPEYETASVNDLFESGNKEVTTLIDTEIKLTQKYPNQSYQVHPDILTYSDYQQAYSNLNYLYIRNIAILVGLVSVLTYFVYFHKHVWTWYKKRKKAKKMAFNQRVDEYTKQIKNEKTDEFQSKGDIDKQ